MLFDNVNTVDAVIAPVFMAVYAADVTDAFAIDVATVVAADGRLMFVVVVVVCVAAVILKLKYLFVF